MVASSSHPQVVQRTARICLRTTPAQAKRCYQLLRAANVWAWLLDSNRDRRQQGDPAVVGYQALRLPPAHQPRRLRGAVGGRGARSVVQRYSDAWFEAARLDDRGERAGFPRRKRFLVPIRFYNGTFFLDGDRRVRLPVAKGHPELWVRLARPLPYLPDQVRSVTLLHDAGRLWLSVTAAVPVEQHDLDPDQVSGVDLGIIHPYAVVTQDAGLLVSGRAVRAESYLHLKDQQARQARAVGRAPKAGQRGSRRWRRYRRAQRRAEARHRRRVHQPHHQAARQVIAFAIAHRVRTLVVGDPTGITGRDAGRVQNWRLRQWRRTHLLGSATRQGRAGRDPSALGGGVGDVLDLPGLPPTRPQATRAPVQLSALQIPGAS